MKQSEIKIKCRSGRQLVATVERPDDLVEPAPAVLMLHGLNSNRQNYIERSRLTAEHAPATYIALDQTAHGDSAGEFAALSGQEILTDLTDVYDFVVDKFKPDTVHLLGASWGGYMAVLLAAERPVASLFLRAPANFPPETFTNPFGSTDKSKDREFRQRDDLNCDQPEFSAIKKFHGSVFIVEMEKDEAVPHRVIEQYIKCAGSQDVERVVMKGFSHVPTNDDEEAQLQELRNKWFANQLKQV